MKRKSTEQKSIKVSLATESTISVALWIVAFFEIVKLLETVGRILYLLIARKGW